MNIALVLLRDRKYKKGRVFWSSFILVSRFPVRSRIYYPCNLYILSVLFCNLVITLLCACVWKLSETWTNNILYPNSFFDWNIIPNRRRAVLGYPVLSLLSESFGTTYHANYLEDYFPVNGK